MKRRIFSCLAIPVALAAATPRPVTFHHPLQFAAGNDPNSAGIADFNHDGQPDVAVLSRSGSVSILLNNANGFAAPVTYAAGSAQGSMVIADLNQDGNADIAVVDGSSSIYVLLGNGDGTFQQAITIPLPSPALDLVVDDFNGDGIPDLAVAAGSVLILLGQGHGVFAAPIATVTKNPAAALVAGDFNHDGKLDLAVDTHIPKGYGRYSLVALLGNGDGTFQPAKAVLSDYSSTHLLVHDINGDGIEDIVDGPQVLYGNGDGTFQSPVQFPAEDGADGWIALADVNHDGHLDILSANTTGDISISLGSGGGVFEQPYSYLAGTSPRWIGAANFLGHGFSDIVVIAEDRLALFPDTADGKYGAEPTIDLNQTALGNPVLADFNGDGNLDAAVLSYGPSISILLGDGKGGFANGTAASAGPVPVTLITADFNGDGKPDLAVADGQTGLVYILRGNGDGTFSAGATVPLPGLTCPNRSTGGGSCYELATVDLNGDGIPDLIAIGGQTDVSYSEIAEAFLGNGDGTFGEALPIASSVGGAFQIGDFNSDGFPDLILSTAAAPQLYRGNGDGTFQNPVAIYDQEAQPVAVGHFNNDGHLDVAIVDSLGALVVLLGNGHAKFLKGQTLAQFTSSGPVIVADLNGDGHPDLLTTYVDSKALTIYLGDAGGTFTLQTGAGISCVTAVGCSVAAGDVNDDGKLDIFAIQTGNAFTVTPITVLVNTTP